MKKFIAYFDYLGYKNFILNNEFEKQKLIVGNLLVDVERALSNGETSESSFDISKSNINCLNFSDTVVFWTNDNSITSLKELLRVSWEFSYSSIIHSFPTRGTLVFDEFDTINYLQQMSSNSKYNVGSLFGKGLIKAHLKTENQNWAGTVIDDSIICELQLQNEVPEIFLSEYAKKYKVPYKKPFLYINCGNQEIEYVLLLAKSKLSIETFKSKKDRIKRNFNAYNKAMNVGKVNEKLNNTIRFLKTFL